MPTTPPRPVFSVQHVPPGSGMADLPIEKGRRADDYEYRIMTIPPRESAASVRGALVEQAEYGRWELARTRKYLGGGKKVWLRRRVIRVASTLGVVGAP